MIRSLSLRLALPLALFAGACADAPTISPATPGGPFLSAAPGAPVIPGRYIVVFRQDVSQPARLAAELAAAHGGTLHHTYQHALKGFAATLPAGALAGLGRNPNVAYIQHDQAATPTAIQTPAPWALDRVDQRSLPLDNGFTYNYDGRGVRIYVIDSGIDRNHPQFGGRAIQGYDVCFRECNAGDGYGHGTQVAGLAGSATYGVAKGVTLVPVRVYSNAGPGRDTLATTSTMMAGVDWVTGQKWSNTSVPMIANISSSFLADQALDDAVRGSINAGVTYVIGAGNFRYDACYYSPSRVTEALVVGGSTRTDQMGYLSNYGSCVDLYAPSTDITSTAVGGDSITGLSGTSYAAPLVAGFAAQYLQAYPASSPASVHSAVIYYSTKNVLTGLLGASYNRLLYTNWVLGQSGRPPGCCL